METVKITKLELGFKLADGTESTKAFRINKDQTLTFVQGLDDTRKGNWTPNLTPEQVEAFRTAQWKAKVVGTVDDKRFTHTETQFGLYDVNTIADRQMMQAIASDERWNKVRKHNEKRSAYTTELNELCATVERPELTDSTGAMIVSKGMAQPYSTNAIRIPIGDDYTLVIGIQANHGKDKPTKLVRSAELVPNSRETNGKGRSATYVATSDL